MAYEYEVEVKFQEDTATPHQHARYKEVLMMYDGVGVGHKKTETSTMHISSRKELTQEGLARFLSDEIPILSFKRME